MKYEKTTKWKITNEKEKQYLFTYIYSKHTCLSISYWPKGGDTLQLERKAESNGSLTSAGFMIKLPVG